MYPTYEWILSKPLYKHTLTDGRTEKATYSGTSSAMPKKSKREFLNLSVVPQCTPQYFPQPQDNF